MTTIREAIAAYCDVAALASYVTSESSANLWHALRQPRETIPAELEGFLAAVHALFTPPAATAIREPADVVAVLMPEAAVLRHERLWVVCLNARHEILHIDRLYDGTVDCCVVRVAEVFRSAIQHTASAIMVVHNHPGGSHTASPDDRALVQQVVAAGRTLDIDVLDALIVGHGAWSSMRRDIPQLF